MSRNPGNGSPTTRTVVPSSMASLVERIEGNGRARILMADNLGVRSLTGWIRSGLIETLSPIDLVPGAPGEAPNRGCSEVHLGQLKEGRSSSRHHRTLARHSGRRLLGEDPDRLRFGPRTVIDDTLDQGHALWVADVDGDGDDEIFAGHRGKDHRVSLYDFDGDATLGPHRHRPRHRRAGPSRRRPRRRRHPGRRRHRRQDAQRRLVPTDPRRRRTPESRRTWRRDEKDKPLSRGRSVSGRRSPAVGFVRMPGGCTLRERPESSRIPLGQR